MEVFPFGPVGPLVGVRSEVIPLGLKEVGGELPASVAVEEREGRAHGRGWNSRKGGPAYGPPPAVLAATYNFLEVRIQKQALEGAVSIEGLFDFAEEAAANDAAPLHMRAISP